MLNSQQSKSANTWAKIKKLNRLKKLKGKNLKKLTDKQKAELAYDRATQKRKSYKYHLLRQSVLERADGRCECCGRPTDELVVHHAEMVKENPKRVIDPSNLYAICTICHAEFHPWIR